MKRNQVQHFIENRRVTKKDFFESSRRGDEEIVCSATASYRQ